METHSQFISRLKSKLRDLKIAHQFLDTQLKGEGDILHYYKQEIKDVQEELDVALSSY